MTIPKKHHLNEKRRYIRLDSVFPVEFKLISLDNKVVLSQWMQGFTRNICQGGLCLEINKLNQELAKFLETQEAKFSLSIEMPVAKKPVNATAKIIWMGIDPDLEDKYLIGLSYENIDQRHSKKIMLYAWMKKLFVPLTMSLMVLLAAGFVIGSLINNKLTQNNKAIVEQLVRVGQETSITQKVIKDIAKNRQDLLLKINGLELEIGEIKKEKQGLSQSNKRAELERLDKIKNLNYEIDKLADEKNELVNKLTTIQTKEKSAEKKLISLDLKKARLEKVNMEKMYRWLVIHQNHRSGLVMSFEGDNEISGWAFTYDQSLAAQNYCLQNDFERTKKVLDFYKNKAKKGEFNLFYNAYYVGDGSPAEYAAHVGPNVWLGIAAVQYFAKTKDNSYLPLAEEIAQGVMKLQLEDKEGGIRGAPDVTWFSTEHNLDAYAFFNMLHQVLGGQEYLLARDKVLKWLVEHTYDKSEIPVSRGKGDSTIATDTYAWSIAAIGPEKLIEINMDPDKIMEFVENSCAMELNYQRPEGNLVRVKGFDFAPQKHLARGGVISPEWTSQMIISYKILADFYSKKNNLAKAKNYQDKADVYLSSLANMIISSPSPSGQGESCLPYATSDNVDTGHGWKTPKGKSTGSVAGTAYALFAYYGYNPLELRE